MEQVNTHLDHIALKHAAHDPSKTSHFIKKEGRGQDASAVLLFVVMRYYITSCNDCKLSGFHDGLFKLVVWVLILCSCRLALIFWRTCCLHPWVGVVVVNAKVIRVRV